MNKLRTTYILMHINLLIIIGMETLLIYHSIMAVIACIETEQESKLSTTWVINASFQLINVIGKKQRINTKENIFTGQDI